ncbi:hypothetical protein ScPMuIL_018817 [Solemya velum]
MSKFRTQLCSSLLKDNFGDVVSTVGTHLLKSGSCPLKQIAGNTGVGVEQVKKVLRTLIQRHLVRFEQNKKGFLEYHINVSTILWQLRYPRYIYCAKTLYGDAAELLVEELLQKGQSTLERSAEAVTRKLNEALESAGHSLITSAIVKEKFASMVKTHFLRRCLDAKRDDEEKVISLCSPPDEEQLYQLPPMEVDGEVSKKRKRSLESSDQPNKRLKTEGRGSENIMWQVDFERFHQHFRDQLLVSATENRIDKKAAEVLRTVLRLSETKTDALATMTNPVSFNEVLHALPKELGLNNRLLEQYLSMMSDDTAAFITKVGESSGGLYVVNIYQSLAELCKAHMENVVQERFGSKSVRIFRVLLLKRHLEQKQIEELAMVPAKEAKDRLYTMFADNFITLTEISKTPDHAPARTFYLFRVDINQVARMLLEKSYKAVSNAMVRRESELTRNKRLLEKQERVAAIAATLEQNGVEGQKEEIEQIITPAEITQLAKIKHVINKLDSCEMQLDETIFMLEMFLLYSEQVALQK